MEDHRDTMLTSYMALCRQSWADEAFRKRLLDSPREALAEHGWQLPEATEVEVGFTDAPKEEPETPAPRGAYELAAAWEQAIEDGRLHLLIPSRPPPGLETEELSDEQLETAAGGTRICNGEVCWSFE